MRIEYERACKEAGLPEEKIKEIRRVFDADYKKLKRKKATKNRADLFFCSFELLKDPKSDLSPYFFQDLEVDVEKMIIHTMDLDKLHEVLERIPVRDREFIMDCFEAEYGGMEQVAEKYGLTLGAAKVQRIRIIKRIKKLFFDEEIGVTRLENSYTSEK